MDRETLTMQERVYVKFNASDGLDQMEEGLRSKYAGRIGVVSSSVGVPIYGAAWPKEGWIIVKALKPQEDVISCHVSCVTRIEPEEAFAMLSQEEGGVL